LQYEYEQTEAESGQPLLCLKDMQASFRELPTEQQELLMQYATNGNVKQIRNQANQLKEDAQWTSLGNHICEMVMKYDMDGLLQLFSNKA